MKNDNYNIGKNKIILTKKTIIYRGFITYRSKT